MNYKNGDIFSGKWKDDKKEGESNMILNNKDNLMEFGKMIFWFMEKKL